MERALVGYTGFVGSNIASCADLDGMFNTKNIEEAYGSKPELLIYAGVRAEKFLANHQPEKDMELIQEAFDNICKIDPKRLILISTSDVYKVPLGVDENTSIDEEGLHAYGLDRYRLECMVRERYPEAVIVRLPALFGEGLKKNFIYDYIHRIPPMLTEAKYHELRENDDSLVPFYEDQGNGFYKCRSLSNEEQHMLRGYFVNVGFSSLQFTDSRSCVQFYPLSRLWADLEAIMDSGHKLVNIVTELVSAGEVYSYLCGENFINETAKGPALYDIHSVYAEELGGSGSYMIDKGTVLDSLKRFVDSKMA